MRTGGGINDGGTMVSCDHTSGKPTLTIVAVQYLNTERRAKRLELVFDRLRDTFALRKDTARGNSSHHILFGNEASSAPSQ